MTRYHALLRSACATAVALVLGHTAHAQSTPFTYQDMLMLDRISDLSVDPAGDYVQHF